MSNETGTISPSGPSATCWVAIGVPLPAGSWRAAAGELDVDRLAGVTVGLQIAGDVERVVREGAGGNDQVADGDVVLGGGRADADGVERHLGLLGGFDRGAGLDAGVLGAIGNDDHAGERRIVVEPQLIGQRLAEAGLRAAGLKFVGPVDWSRVEGRGSRVGGRAFDSVRPSGS